MHGGGWWLAFNAILAGETSVLIRDLKFLDEHPDPRNRRYGRRLLDRARDLFAVIHRRESMTPEVL